MKGYWSLGVPGALGNDQTKRIDQELRCFVVLG